MAAWWAPDAVQSIRRQASLVGRRRALRMPAAWGAWAAVARAGLACIRQPGVLVPLAVWGGMVAQLAAWAAGASPYPAQWALWLGLAMAAPPWALTGAFRADARNPFLRQLLLCGNLRLLVADALLPWLVLVAVALACWLVGRLPLSAAAPVVAIIVAVAALLALCQAVAVVRVPSFASNIPYPLAVVVSLGAVVAASALTRRPLAGLGVAVAAGAALAALIARSREVAAG